MQIKKYALKFTIWRVKDFKTVFSGFFIISVSNIFQLKNLFRWHRIINIVNDANKLYPLFFCNSWGSSLNFLLYRQIAHGKNAHSNLAAPTYNEAWKIKSNESSRYE